ncbi:MAG: hypothetical protein Q8S73_22825 [Deltaproteobacteria bacterium]|nr:hypothetical protein [Myxococcales bacterium]MDP3216963.1 hypothetical protein [Deltaproteobacteria bacterium]
MTVDTSPSAEAFKQTLERRLRTATRSGAEFARWRQLLVFDRFLARESGAFDARNVITPSALRILLSVST